MTRIYSGILTLIERDPRSIVGDKRLRLGGLSKCAIATSSDHGLTWRVSPVSLRIFIILI